MSTLTFTAGGMPYKLRAVRPGDEDTITRQRHLMFVDAGRPDNALLKERSAAFREWLAPRLADGRYYGWFAENQGVIAAGLGMMTVEWAPHPMHLEPARGYIMNVYTEPAHRRRKLAQHLTAHAIAEARKRGIHVLFLHATDAGKLVYQAAGFTARNEMMLELKD